VANPPTSSTLLIGTSRPSLGPLDLCLHAVTLTAWSCALNCPVVIAQTCKQWTCRHCGERKASALAATAAHAKPNKLITLTINPALHETPRSAFDVTRRKCCTLVQMIRRSFGSFEYMRVLELTKKGWPHYHFVARCGFIPQPWLSDKWDKLTGAPIVDVRALKKTREAYWYVMKYLGKQKYCEWTTRRVTISRGFVPKHERRSASTLDLQGLHREHQHPRDFFYWNWPQSEWTKIGPLVFALHPTLPQSTEKKKPSSSRHS